jgi:hypothetical protein
VGAIPGRLEAPRLEPERLREVGPDVVIGDGQRPRPARRVEPRRITLLWEGVEFARVGEARASRVFLGKRLPDELPLISRILVAAFEALGLSGAATGACRGSDCHTFSPLIGSDR